MLAFTMVQPGSISPDAWQEIGATAPFTERILRSIIHLTPDAWAVIATTFDFSRGNDKEDVVATNATTMVFTEGLLRPIIHLLARLLKSPHQKIKIIPRQQLTRTRQFSLKTFFVPLFTYWYDF